MAAVADAVQRRTVGEEVRVLAERLEELAGSSGSVNDAEATEIMSRLRSIRVDEAMLRVRRAGGRGRGGRIEGRAGLAGTRKTMGRTAGLEKSAPAPL